MLRTLFKSDLIELLEIEKAVHIVPWTEDTFKACFQSGYLGWVIELEKKIIGFIIISLSKEECHILNVCVLHQYQRQGLGQKLLEKVLNFTKKKGIKIVYLEVRKSNSRAISLYQKMKFQQVGERKNYYPSPIGKEDALIFALSLQ